jgi:myosin heavy chain 9/10/11/14
MQDAFLSIGFTRDEIIECLAPLAAILHLSNINIVGEEGSSKFSLDSTESVKAACACLGVMVSAFEYAILSREMMVNSERLKLPRNVIEARSDLAALSKLIYYKTFEDLVKRLNKKMLSKGEEK